MIASIEFFSTVNYLAVFVAALAYFVLGALWYSVLFGKIWAKGREEMGVKMSKPDSSQMIMMMLKSYAANLLCAFAMAFFLKAADNGHNMIVGLKLGIVGGCGLSLSSLLMMANWQNTKRSILIIDAGYQVIGVLITSVIIAVWQ
jgi:hypothetical protein